MGTNYYLKTNACAHCGRSDEPLHIGKSSAGWCFALHIYPQDGIKDLEDWKLRWVEGQIVDENGTQLSHDEMLSRITERLHPIDWSHKLWTTAGYASETRFHDANNSVRGPDNLLRHKLDGRFCIGHGEGTWDLIIGEFS